MFNTVCFWLVSSMHLSQLGAQTRNRRPFSILIPKTLDYNFINTLFFLYPVVSQDQDLEHNYNLSFRLIMKTLISCGLRNQCRCFDYCNEAVSEIDISLNYHRSLPSSRQEFRVMPLLKDRYSHKIFVWIIEFKESKI